VATELDVLRSEVAIENAKVNVVRAQGVLELSRANVNAVMLRPIDAPFEPAESLAFEAFDTPLDEVIRIALAERPEVRSVALTERIDQELVTIAKADKKPSFDFNGGYGWSVREPENFFDSRYSKWAFGVNVRWPLFDGFRTDGRVMQAEAKGRQTTQDRLAIENRIRVEAKDAYERLITAARVLGAADLNVTQARKAVELTQANFKYGAATIVDVADAQTALLVAELTRTQALVTHANARATLRYVMGRTVI
jgi:HAE1 family hydrophobic/amphiphilic exporter-1